jgi:hypothetical protein
MQAVSFDLLSGCQALQANVAASHIVPDHQAGDPEDSYAFARASG